MMISPAETITQIKKTPNTYIITIISCMGIATFFWILGNGSPFYINVIVSLCIGSSVYFFVTTLIPLLKGFNIYAQWSLSIIILLFSMLVGIGLGYFFIGGNPFAQGSPFYSELGFNMFAAFFFSLILIIFFYIYARLTSTEIDSLQLQLAHTEKDKQLNQAQLNLLQAQIEPHFLFNTLANIHGLIHEKSDLATSLLEKTNDYLRAALNHSRSKSCLLSDETSLLQAYLEIMKVRMGERLDFDILVDESAAKLSFPPMLLQPLVENAIKHGLEPKIEGGSLQISGMVKDGKLCLDVIDTGIGFENFKSEGVGLSNVRERLQKLYGDKAEFHISALGNRGVISSIQIPVELL